MKVNMKPISTIKVSLGIDPNGPTRSFFTNSCAKHMDKYVPMREGTLRRYKIDGSNIVYGEKGAKFYAKYQYKGMREDGSHVVKHYTIPGTGSYWDKRMMSAEKNILIDEVQKFMKRGGN